MFIKLAWHNNKCVSPIKKRRIYKLIMRIASWDSKSNIYMYVYIQILFHKIRSTLIRGRIFLSDF